MGLSSSPGPPPSHSVGDVLLADAWNIGFEPTSLRIDAIRTYRFTLSGESGSYLTKAIKIERVCPRICPTRVQLFGGRVIDGRSEQRRSLGSGTRNEGAAGVLGVGRPLERHATTVPDTFSQVDEEADAVRRTIESSQRPSPTKEELLARAMQKG